MAPESHQLTASRSAILIVDDEEALARGLARVLRKMDYTVALAADGEQALELITKLDFDVVLSDVRMPGIDGLELIRRMRELALGVPVVLMTGTPCVNLAAQALACGASGFLTKPLDHEGFVATLDEAISLHRTAR